MNEYDYPAMAEVHGEADGSISAEHKTAKFAQSPNPYELLLGK